MKKTNEGKSGKGMGTLLLVLAPALCCGGFVLLPVILGSAGIAAIGALISNPLVQVLGVIGVVFAVYAFRRRKNGRAKAAAELSGAAPGQHKAG